MTNVQMIEELELERIRGLLRECAI